MGKILVNARAFALGVVRSRRYSATGARRLSILHKGGALDGFYRPSTRGSSDLQFSVSAGTQQ